ncbi:MAG TPA: antibiotic biosynthesis monooxygenase [Desulfomonilaceae bacterium]|nr:antibiotic biosynthesis monooxygenase [Desulfomonilaceae bacterium]
MSVIVINPFEIPEGIEDQFLTFWERVAGYMRRQPGFISALLHRSLSQDARFHFINIAEWESAEHVQAAIETDEFRQLTEPYLKVFSLYPAMYEVIRKQTLHDKISF